MKVIKDEQQICRCYEECQEFQKLVELQDSGLAVYCHRPREENIRQAEVVESDENTSRDVFLLYNKKDVKITSSELSSELGTKNISCPRCRKTFEHAEKLTQEVKSIDRKVVMGICDHCHKKATTKTTTTTFKKPFCTCDEIVKKFTNVKGEQKKDIKKYIKIWLSKMRHLLRDEITLIKPKPIKSRSYSDLQIKQGLSSPASRREPEIQQMFYLGTHNSDINLNTEMSKTNLKEGHMKQAVAFFQPIEHVKTTYAHTPHESDKINAMISTTSLKDSDITFVETYVKELPRTSLKDRKQEEVFEDGPSIDAKEALKRRHDLSLRQMMRLEKNSRVPYSVSKRPDIYETPKITPWVQKEATSKYHVESEVDVKIPKLKHDRGPRGTRVLDYASNRDVKFRSKRASQDSYYEPSKADKYHHDKIKQELYDSEEGPKKVKKLEDRYITDEELKLQRSVDKISQKVKKTDQYVAKSKHWHTKTHEPKESVGFVLKTHNRFFFPKVMEKKKTQVKLVSSSYLIKDTQEKFRLQAERDMKIREEERQQKLDQDQKKKLAREEKKLQAEEKIKQTVADKKKLEVKENKYEKERIKLEDKKYAEAQRRQEDKTKSDKTKGDTLDKDGDMFSEYEQKGKISKESGVAKKDLKLEPDRIHKELDKQKKGIKTKPEQVDKIDEVLQKAKTHSKSKPEQRDKTAELLQKAKKDLKSKPEQDDKSTELMQKAKKDLKSKPEKEDKPAELLQKAKKDLKPKPEQEDKTAELLQKAKKDLKSKPEQQDKTAELLQKAKKDLESKPGKEDKPSELLQKAKKDLKSKPEQEDKTAELLQKAKKDLESKPEKEDKPAELLQKAKMELKSKPEQEDETAKLLQKAKKDLESKPERMDKIDEVLESKKKKDVQGKDEPANKQDIIVKKQEEKKEKGGKQKESKVEASSKMKRDSSEEIKVSMSKIAISITKGGKDEPTNKQDTIVEKQEEKKEKGGKQKESKVETSTEEAEFKKLQAKHAKEKEEAIKKKKQLEYEAKKEKGGKQIESKVEASMEKAGPVAATKNTEDLSKEVKSSKMKRDSSEEIKVSMSKIAISITKGGKDEPANKQDIIVEKQEEKKEKGGKQKESKVETSTEEAEFKKLQAKHAKEKEEAIKKKKQLEYEAKKEKGGKQKESKVEASMEKAGSVAATKNTEDLSKEVKSSKMKRDSSEEIKVSMSKIAISITKGGKDEPANKQDIIVEKQEEKKEKGGKQKESKVETSTEEAEFKKLQAKHAKEKEEAIKKKKQLEYEAKKEKGGKQKESKVEASMEKARPVAATKKTEDQSKEVKSSKMKRDSSEEIKVSMSKIAISITKGGKDEPANKQDIIVKKQEEKKEKGGKQKESKVETSTEEAEFKKLQAIHAKEKEAIKKKKQLEYEAKKEKGGKQKESKVEASMEKARPVAATKKTEDLSKEVKSSKMKRDSSEEIKVSMSKIAISITKGGKDEPANKQDIIVKKQEEKKEKGGKQKESKVETSTEVAEFKKLQAIHAKEKEAAIKKKKQLEYEAKVAKAQKEAELKEKPVKLNMHDFKIRTGLSEGDFILRLVRIKQAAKMKPSDIDPKLIMEHKLLHNGVVSSTLFCPLCLNSNLELDVLSLDEKKKIPEEIITDIIIGEKFFKMRHLKKIKEPDVVPKLQRQIFFEQSDLPPKEIVQIIPLETEPDQKNKKMTKKDVKEIEMEPGKGILRYSLSDRTFIEKGWTMLPTEKVVRKMNVYRMRPAHPEFDWFEHNKNKRLMTYDTGERLAEFDDNGRGRWYYRNGRLALDYYDAEETNAQQRFVIYSSGEPDERGRTHPITILATFDYLGNGIVFDHTGKIRLKYNQTEGVVLDRGIGPVSHWKWHTLNDPPVLQKVMIDTQMAHKDPYILNLGPAADKATRPDNEEMLAIEFDNFIKEKSKKLSQKFKPFQIKMKALKINEHFSLKVLDQATVYLIFRDGSTNLKLNIGMILDHQEIVDTDTAEVGEVSNSLERFPARTDSLAGLQRTVAHAQRYERQHAERERRLRPPEPCASADHLTAAASPPLRLPLRTVPTGSSSCTGYCIRKPTNNLYYNTRLI